MARPLLKPHASLFAALLRALDPAVALATGAAAFVLYRPEVTTPEPYLLFAVAGAITIVALFPAFGLYGPQRGASLADELRNLLLAWLVIAALAAGALFATKLGEAFSRVWVAAWLAGGFAATDRDAHRAARRAARAAQTWSQPAAHRDRGRRRARSPRRIASGRRRVGRLQCRGVLRRRHGQARDTRSWPRRRRQTRAPGGGHRGRHDRPGLDRAAPPRRGAGARNPDPAARARGGNPLCSRYFRISPAQSLVDRGRRLAAAVADRDADDGLGAFGQGARGLRAGSDRRSCLRCR